MIISGRIIEWNSSLSVRGKKRGMLLLLVVRLSLASAVVLDLNLSDRITEGSVHILKSFSVALGIG